MTIKYATIFLQAH